MTELLTDTLQWDRAFDGAEIYYGQLTGGGGLRLQWDRAFDGAEMNEELESLPA